MKFIFFLFYWLQCTYSLYITSPGLNNGSLFYANHLESPFCTTAPQKKLSLNLIYIDNTIGCLPSIPQNINLTNKAILYEDGGTCNRWEKLKHFQTAGARASIGFAIQKDDNQFPGGPVQLDVPGALVLSILDNICLGITRENGLLLKQTLLSNYSISVILYQKSLQPNQTQALKPFLPLFNGDNWNDLCTTTLRSFPSRPGVIQCNEEGMISSLRLLPNLRGTFSEELSVFSALYLIQLVDLPDLVGSFPLSLGNWSRLEVLSIVGTGLNFIAPELFQFWPRLRHLNLRGNKLTSPLPSIISQNLFLLFYDMMPIQGSIPQTLVQQPYARYMSFAQNLLTGVLPDFSMCTRLQKLDLSRNRFSVLGRFPSNLVSLQLGDSGLTQSPDVSLMTNLRFLDLRYNQLSSFPNLTALNQLTELHLEFNQIEGVIDTQNFPTNLASLQYLYLTGNKLTGLHDLARYFNLQEIYLGFNQLLEFPDFSGLTMLQRLDVSYNNLQGSFRGTVFPRLPPAGPPYPPLRSLSVRGNNLTDRAPRTQDVLDLRSFPELTDLDISDNDIELWFPRVNFFPSVLERLILSGNPFKGDVPSEIGQLDRLSDLRVVDTNLRSPNEDIPSFMVYSFDRFTTINARGIQCPEITMKRDPLARIMLDPEFYDFRFCRCAPNYYYVPNLTDDSRVCQPCLLHAICPGGEQSFDNVTANVNIIAQHGYYPTPSVFAPTSMIPCQFGVTRPTQKDNPCNNAVDERFVPQNATVAFACLEGTTDRLCSKCEVGYYNKNGKCLKCDRQATHPTFLILSVVLLLILGTYFVFPQLAKEEEAETFLARIGAILIDFFQTTSIITSRLNNPDVTEGLQSVLKLAIFFTSTSGIGLECLADNPDFLMQYYWTVAIPGLWFLFMAFVFCMKWVTLHFILHRIIVWTDEQALFLRGLLMICNFVYFPLVTSILSAFSCSTDPVTGVRYLTDHPYLRCDVVPLPAKVIPLIIYLAGIYLVFTILSCRLCDEDRRADPYYVTLFGFFYLPFYGGTIWAGVFLMLIRLQLSIIVALVDFKEDYFGLLIVWVLLCRGLFVIYQEPYRFPALNTFELISSVLMIVMFLNTIIFTSASFDQSAFPAFTWFLLVFGFGIVALIIMIKDKPSRLFIANIFSSIKNINTPSSKRMKKIRSKEDGTIHESPSAHSFSISDTGKSISSKIGSPIVDHGFENLAFLTTPEHLELSARTHRLSQHEELNRVHVHYPPSDKSPL